MFCRVLLARRRRRLVRRLERKTGEYGGVENFETVPGRRVVGWGLHYHEGDKNYVPVVCTTSKCGAQTITHYWLPVLGEWHEWYMSLGTIYRVCPHEGLSPIRIQDFEVATHKYFYQRWCGWRSPFRTEHHPPRAFGTRSRFESTCVLKRSTGRKINAVGT